MPRLYVWLVCLGIAACGGLESGPSGTFGRSDGCDSVSEDDVKPSEVCNGIDDDCDGLVDEAPSGAPLRQPCTSGCGRGVERCVEGVWMDCSAPTPEPEQCNNLDDDCDGAVDNGIACGCINGDTRACGSDEGRCRAGIQQCLGGEWQASCFGEVGPAENETCNNGIDDDCNGRIDEGCECVEGETLTCGTDRGECVAGQITCAANGRWGPTCEGAVDGRPETCDGLDNDCDGEVDWTLSTNFGWQSDANEPSDTCVGALSLPTAVDSAGWVSAPVADPSDLTTYPNLYPPGADADWFRFVAEEVTHGACVPLTSQCAYVLVLQLALEAGADPADYELCLATEDRCTDVSPDTEICATTDNWDASSEAYLLAVKWGGVCGRDDSRQIYVRVRSAERRFACGYYQLSANFRYDPSEACP